MVQAQIMHRLTAQSLTIQAALDPNGRATTVPYSAERVHTLQKVSL